jgi:hypothetical protein
LCLSRAPTTRGSAAPCRSRRCPPTSRLKSPRWCPAAPLRPTRAGDYVVAAMASLIGTNYGHEPSSSCRLCCPGAEGDSTLNPPTLVQPLTPLTPTPTPTPPPQDQVHEQGDRGVPVRRPQGHEAALPGALRRWGRGRLRSWWGRGGRGPCWLELLGLERSRFQQWDQDQGDANNTKHDTPTPFPPAPQTWPRTTPPSASPTSPSRCCSSPTSARCR